MSYDIFRGFFELMKAALNGVRDTDIPRATLQWLPDHSKPDKQQSQQETKRRDEYGFIETIDMRQDELIQVWELLDISIPPLLAQKFHTINISQLMTKKNEKSNLGVATWFVLWCKTLNLPLFNIIHTKHEEKKRIMKTSSKGEQKTNKLNSWSEEMEKIANQVGLAVKDKAAPSLKDNAKKASEFLLEPCIIIQLPWNMVLLQQWLAAAMAEVLIFEKNSLELRHWFLPREIEDCVIELLCCVKQLKERLVLGYAILCKQIISYPETNKNHPEWILDQVVLPAVKVLQFLITGKAYAILKSLKKIAWSKSEPCNARTCAPREAYWMDGFLEAIYVDIFNGIHSWVADNEQPFSADKLKKVDFAKVIEEMNKNHATLPEKSQCDCRKKFSLMEQTIYYYVQHFQKHSDLKKSSEERLQLVKNLIQDKLVSTDRVSASVYLKWLIVMTTEDECASLSFTCPDTLGVQALVTATMMKKRISHFLENTGVSSVNSSIVRLALEVLDREQVIRIIRILYDIEGASPVIPNLDKSPATSINEIENQLRELRTSSTRREWLWSRFPAEWTMPVSEKNAQLLLNQGCDKIMKLCEMRLGRIVFNSVQISLSQKKPEDAFQDWQTVQYIVPCYIASLLESLNQRCTTCTEYKHNIIKLIDGLLKHYEKKFLQWKQNAGKQSKIVENVTHHEIFIVVSYYTELIEFFQKVHISTGASVACELDDVENLHGFNDLAATFVGWTALGATGHKISCVNDMVKTWLLSSLTIEKDIYATIIESWQPLVPSAIRYAISIGDYYMAELVLTFLVTLHKSIVSEIPDDDIIPQETMQLTFKVQAHIQHEKGMLCGAFVHSTYSEKLRGSLKPGEHFLKEKVRLTEMYKALKALRLASIIRVPTFTLKNLPSNLPELKVAAEFYINADFESLEKMLPLISKKTKRTTTDLKPPKSFRVSVKMTDNASCKSESKKVASYEKDRVKKCHYCGKIEPKAGKFLVCGKCLEQKYPDVNCYCSDKCKEARWEAETLAEHLEFELGLGAYANTKQ